MKIFLLFVMSLFMFFGCARQEPMEMTLQEKEKAKKEIKEVVNLIISGLEKLDAESTFQKYLNTTDFILFMVQGTMADYQTALNEHKGWFQTLSSLKVNSVKEEIRFMPGSIVIYPWLGRFDMTFKSGEQLVIDFGVTMIFRKIENQWTVVYQQTSQIPSAMESPGK